MPDCNEIPNITSTGEFFKWDEKNWCARYFLFFNCFVSLEQGFEKLIVVAFEFGQRKQKMKKVGKKHIGGARELSGELKNPEGE